MLLSKHSLTDRQALDVSENQVVTIDINFSNRGLYTKSLNGIHIRVGKSLRTLADSSIYEPGVRTSPLNPALVQFKLIDNSIKLTTTYPFISILNLGRTAFDLGTYEDEEPYLGIDGNGNVLNKPIPSFKLGDLAEVFLPTLGPNYNNFIVCSDRNIKPGNKEPFYNGEFYYHWTLKPEATKLLLLDDAVNNQPNLPQQVIACEALVGQGTPRVANAPFRVVYDKAPTLSTHLQADGRTIRNQVYPGQVFNLTTGVGTVICNCNKYNMFVINCFDVNVIKLRFSYDTVYSDVLVPVAVFIKNFEGAIDFAQDVEFENGIPLSLIGKSHILNCLLYNTGSNLKVRVMQKATNLSRVPS